MNAVEDYLVRYMLLQRYEAAPKALVGEDAEFLSVYSIRMQERISSG